jgi:hypothetical protein
VLSFLGRTFYLLSYSAYTRGVHYWFERQREYLIYPCGSSATGAFLWGLTLPFLLLFTEVIRDETVRNRVRPALEA